MMKLKQTYKVTDMQHDLYKTVQKLQKTVEEKKFKIENKNNCDNIDLLKLKIITLKDHLNALNTNINEMKTKRMFIKSNIIFSK